MSNVHVVDYKERENSDGESFYALILEGEIEMIQSSETGNFYATARRASVTSTFTKERCEQLIGAKMPGRIEKVSCPEYEYTLPETGEVIMLSHRYEYRPEEAEGKLEEEVFERKRSNGAEKPALV